MRLILRRPSCRAADGTPLALRMRCATAHSRAVPRQYFENRWWTCAVQYQERRQCRLTSRVDDLIARNASQNLPMATTDSIEWSPAAY
jgi:hypothetical protein